MPNHWMPILQSGVNVQHQIWLISIDNLNSIYRPLLGMLLLLHPKLLIWQDLALPEKLKMIEL
jgi:hypothetical protein